MKYALSHNGIVHLVNPVMGGEFTMCGDAYDIDENPDHVDDAWQETRFGPVTCPRCAEVIRACRGVSVRISNMR